MCVSRSGGGITIQLSLVGLVVACVALVVAVGLLVYGLGGFNGGGKRHAAAPRANTGPDAEIPPEEMPPWGELAASDIALEQPEEYIAYEIGADRIPTWVFVEMTPDKVQSFMLSCGMSPEQAAHALSPQLATATVSNTVIHPDDELVLSLSPQTRAKLYGELSRNGANHYMRYPFCYPGQSFDTVFGESRLGPALVAMVKKLLYPRGDAQCFSDYEMVLRRAPSEADRLNLLKTLSAQSAVLVRLRIRQSTDIDKVLGYWARGIQVKDVRPLLESVKRLPEGGSLSILYLLPQFARQRLYTFPLPSKQEDPSLDCHWSTMNFFNETPDDRFADPAYTSQYIAANFYPVAKPTLYGDVILLLNDHNQATHSAVYIADDIVFTKNGNNYAQPWMLMRLGDLAARYTTEGPPRVVVYRNKNS